MNFISNNEYMIYGQPYVTALDLDDSGSLLAVGLSTGEVYVYHRKGSMFSLYIQFHSHDTEIVRLRWCKGQTASMLILVTNVNTTKLWKVNKPLYNTLNQSGDGEGLFTRRRPVHHGPREVLKREFTNIPHSHISHVHSLSICSDGETFLSADELRIRLWNLNAGECFNMLDLAPENLHQLTEVLRVAEFHPHQCNMLAYGTSGGAVRLCDLRAAALCDATWRPLGDGTSNIIGPRSDARRLTPSGPLDEYMQGVSDIAFAPAGLHIAARDYGQVRTWDLRVEDRPLATYSVMPRHQLLAHLYNRFEDGVPVDSFRCTFLGGDSLRLATGTYNDQCIVWDVNGEPGKNKVVHVGRDRATATSSALALSNDGNDYSARPKRRKCTENDVDMTVDNNDEIPHQDDEGNTTPTITNATNTGIIVQSFGNTRMKTFTGEMRSEYMVEYDEGYDGHTLSHNNNNNNNNDYTHNNNNNNNNGSPYINFGRKVSAIVPHPTQDIFAIAATGKLYVYDIKR